MERVHRTDGPMIWSITPAWKTQVKAAMRERNLSIRRLARLVGCHPTTVSSLFGMGTQGSRFVQAINSELGLGEAPAPVDVSLVVECGLLREVMDAWPRLSHDQRRFVLQLVDSYAPPRRRA